MAKELNNSEHSRAKVNRGVAALTALSLLATGGCVATEQGGQVVAKIIDEPTKTSPLSPDLTRTPTPSPTDVNYELTPTVVNPATQELTLVSLTEVASETAPTEVIKINMDNIIYPPVGSVKENFEKGEYDEGVETIKKWVNVWEKMGVFEELEVENNSLSLVPLDGRARVVCVDTEKKGTGTMLCPPLDLTTGGIKAVPTDGEWDETDMPLMITLERLEELISKGSETDVAYQFVDKYTKISTRYIEPVAGQIVEGEYQVPGGEIKLPEIIPESMNQIEELSFNMEFKDPKAAYQMLLERVVGNNLENQQFWAETLGYSNPTVDQLLGFAKNNVGGPENKAYWLPFNTNNGTKFNFVSVMGYQSDLRMTQPKIDGTYIDGIYSMFFYPGDLKDLVRSNFVKKLKVDNKEISMGLISGILDGAVAHEFGLLFMNNRFIFISGSEKEKVGLAEYYNLDLGGAEQVFREKIDPAIVSAQYLSYLGAVIDYNPSVNSGTKGLVCTNSLIDCPGGIFSGNLSPEDWVVKVK